MDQQAPPGLRQQLNATIEAARRLARAHIALARAEASEIVDEVKRLVGLALAALGLAFLAALLLFLGGILFLGEWLFGSIGWGVLHGVLLLLDLALVLGLLAVGVPGRRLGRDVGVALGIGIVAALVLGFDLTHRGWSALGDQVFPTVDPAWRASVAAVVALVIVGAILGFVARIRSGGGAAIGAAVGAAALGAILGIITAASISPQVGVALGVLAGLVAWPILSGIGVARTGIDGEALKAKFMPDQSIEQAKETIEWVRARVPLAPKS
ncbi:MAG TPA: hypothetical protein VJ506_07875 [Candidatus Limnocylindrales bacterium]|nr:hypothetical protein [Candidatus Limnocylindrales bacterium]